MILFGLPQPRIAKVDCGSCRACCKNNLIMEMDGDDPALDWIDADQANPNLEGMRVLRKRHNGDCVYLAPTGCTIHGRHPIICRMFDCAGFVQRLDEGAFDGIGERSEDAVTRAGRRRLAGKKPCR